ncbi:hypothetical protein BpHYR1_044787 [Brachionus plicatilis]|uniref:Uncharacterized protein n=1 Tax=Brachionus plicatilis TaxID=10195 RepID=A0A3M7PRB1_BRAPC|nr:hypothetical protein BpHYR1_044787 [Brachionus plicatilis]
MIDPEQILKESLVKDKSLSANEIDIKFDNQIDNSIGSISQTSAVAEKKLFHSVFSFTEQFCMKFHNAIKSSPIKITWKPQKSDLNIIK